MTHRLYPALEHNLSTQNATREAREVRRYAVGDPVEAGEGQVARVIEGVLLLKVAHAGVAQRVIGVLGPGDFLVPHPKDGARVACSAHTDARMELWQAVEAASSEVFRRAMTSRLMRTDAWAATRAHRDADYRVRSSLDLLMMQFGVVHDGGRRLGFHVPRQILADLAVTSEQTVNRVLRMMSAEGILETVGDGAQERLGFTY